MRKTRLGVIAAIVALVALSWAAGADAKGNGQRCSGGSANASHCDLDGDGTVNKEDDDIDGDGVANEADACPRDEAHQCEAEEPDPDPTTGLPGLDDLPPVTVPPVTVPPVEPPPVTVPPVEPPPVPPVEVPPVPELPPVPPAA